MFDCFVAVPADIALTERPDTIPRAAAGTRIDRPWRPLHNRGRSSAGRTIDARAGFRHCRRRHLVRRGRDAASRPARRGGRPGRSGVQHDLRRGLYRERSRPLGEARHQGEDRRHHRHRRDQLGDLRQLAVRAGLGELVRPRQRARPEADRHRHHHRPAVRTDRAAQGDRGGRRLRRQGAARQTRRAAARAAPSRSIPSIR